MQIYTGGHFYASDQKRLYQTHSGQRYQKGLLLIDDSGKIAEIGVKITAPEGAEVIDAGGRLVTPGCIDAHSHIGMWNECMSWEGSDGNESSDPITPQLRAIDSINPIDESFTNAPVITQQHLPLCAALSVQAGLDVVTAWKAITINPATHIGIADRVGSLEKG